MSTLKRNKMLEWLGGLDEKRMKKVMEVGRKSVEVQRKEYLERMVEIERNIYMHVCTYTHLFQYITHVHFYKIIYFTDCGPPKHQRVMSRRQNQVFQTSKRVKE